MFRFASPRRKSPSQGERSSGIVAAHLSAIEVAARHGVSVGVPRAFADR